MSQKIPLVRRRQGRMRWADDRGAAAVEFALVMPILIVILFGIIEFARIWNTKQTLTDAAREGARIAVVNNAMVKPAQALQDSVRRVVYRTASAAALDTTQLTFTPTGVGSGQTATIALQYVYTPLVGLVLNTPITMSTSSVMRNE
ncbi:MAG TPA: TadE/TadG family type IV pilus assembly protein [Longimicrobiales bacterium]|nr:TadE/TadG family type IV pilus assembly protein [Longimicrobiales bacterium]